MIMRFKLRYASVSTKNLCCKTLVRPILEYAATAWTPHHQSLVQDLEKVQRKAARFVCGDYSRESSVTTMMRTLFWDTIKTRHELSSMKLFHSVANQRLGIDRGRYLAQPTYVSGRVDHAHKFQPIRCRIDSFKYSFFPKAIGTWNSLPADFGKH